MPPVITSHDLSQMVLKLGAYLTTIKKHENINRRRNFHTTRKQLSLMSHMKMLFWGIKR